MNQAWFSVITEYGFLTSKKMGMTVGPVFFGEIVGYLAIHLEMGMVNQPTDLIFEYTPWWFNVAIENHHF